MTFPNGAAALWAAASLPAQDTATVRLPAGIHATDSTVDMLLFGDKVTPVVQWIFQKPPWVMWTGAILAGLIGLAIVWWLWGHRQAILTWGNDARNPLYRIPMTFIVGEPERIDDAALLRRRAHQTRRNRTGPRVGGPIAAERVFVARARADGSLP